MRRAQISSTARLPIANLVFQDAVERIYVGNKYTDIPVGIYLVRGENVVMLGEVVSCVDRRTLASAGSPKP